MKIKETIERDCCQEQDLKKYLALGHNKIPGGDPQFCIHCGQVWIKTREPDGSGYSSTIRTPLFLEIPKNEPCTQK